MTPADPSATATAPLVGPRDASEPPDAAGPSKTATGATLDSAVTRWHGRILTVSQIFLLASVYVATGRLGLSMNAVSGFATMVWAPTGLALAALLLIGRRLWPGVFLGAFAVNLWVGAPPWVAAGIALGNTLESVVAVAVLRRVDFHTSMDRIRDVLHFLFVAAVFGTLISACVGVGVLFAAGIVEPGRFVRTWSAWWLGDALGALVLTPLLLVWARPSAAGPARSAIEHVGLAAFMLATSGAVFMSASIDGAPNVELPYPLFLAVMWAALRFGQRGTTATTFVTAVLATAATVLGFGPFVHPELSQSLAYLETFIATVCVTGLSLGAAVAERNAREAQLERLNHELRDAVRARDSFLSVASHELRTPIGALRLQTQMLTRRKEGLADDLKEKLLRIDRQTVRLNRLIDNLLEVSRITADRLTLEPERVDLVGLVREVVARSEEEARRSGSEIRIEAERSIIGEWDPLRLEQVVVNLLSNAIKYGNGGPIDIEVGASANVARLKVRDQGIGIAPEDQERIFKRFEQLIPQRHGGGLGLGLWITREIVEAMGGSIRVVSARGSGSLFVVDLPLPDQAEVRESIPSAGPAEARPILVAEDDVDTLEGVSEFLRSSGYRVVQAANGWEALQCLRRERPTLILLDLAMPIMDGPRFLAELRRERRFAAIPVVLLSAAGRLRETSNSLGVSAYLDKPLDLNLLLATVERHVRVH